MAFTSTLRIKEIGDRTPLWWAAARGHETVVKLLLATDRANPDFKDCYRQTPLLLAAGSGYDAVVKLLLAKDVVDRDSVNNFGRRPLSWAARRGYSNVVNGVNSRRRTRSWIRKDLETWSWLSVGCYQSCKSTTLSQSEPRIESTLLLR